MNVLEDRDFLRRLYPDMMKRTKLLIVNHDVIRYHSFDLIRYQLYQDTINNDFKHFSSLKPKYRKLITPGLSLPELVQSAKRCIDRFNIYECFGDSRGTEFVTKEYSSRFIEMLNDKKVVATPTDIYQNFNIVFDRKDIDGYLIQYHGDTLIPPYYNKLTVYESKVVMDFDLIASIVITHNINAIMVSSALAAIIIAMMVAKFGYQQPITFMIGSYGYNYMHTDDGRMAYPLYNEIFQRLELEYHHEFGYFNPYTSISQQEA